MKSIDLDLDLDLDQKFLLSGKQAHMPTACCSKCQSLTISRIRRPPFRKIFTKQQRFFCHDCRHTFWRNVEV